MVKLFFIKIYLTLTDVKVDTLTSLSIFVIEDKSKRKCQMIFLVRHGQTDWNILGLYQGHTDIELNGVGIRQAEQIKEKLNHVSFDFVFSSPLKRAYQTAQIIHSGHIVTDCRLMERYNGLLEGMKKGEFVVNFADPNEQRFHIETLSAFRKRINDFWNDILKQSSDKNILVVTHAGVGIYSQCYFRGEPPDNDYTQYKMKNCDIITFETDRR